GLSQSEIEQITKIHQAIAIIQFKLEAPIIKRRPNFEMEERLVLESIDYENHTATLYGKTYALEHTCFQTIDPSNPNALTEDEQDRKSTRLNSSHVSISYAVFCLKKK